MGAEPWYILSEGDSVQEGFTDTGTDILGSSDAILGGCDTYTEAEYRDLVDTITDYGTSSAPLLIQAYGWDQFNLTDSGSSTLTTNGHVYATDTYNYNENTGEIATESESVSGSGIAGEPVIGKPGIWYLPSPVHYAGGLYLRAGDGWSGSWDG